MKSRNTAFTEMFDIFDENMQKIGTASRHDTHLHGLWHQTFHCWVIRRSPEGSWSLLFQLRDKEKDSYPSLLDISCAGHLLAGETVADGVRELEEELGLRAPFADLLPCGVFTEDTVVSERFIDREFCHVFLYECNQPLTEYEFQKSEVSGLFFVDMDDFRQLIQGERNAVTAEGIVLDEQAAGIRTSSREVVKSDFVPHPKEYYNFVLCKIREFET